MAKTAKKSALILPDEVVMNKIYLIRGQKGYAEQGFSRNVWS
jgi:hypothetical protein